MRLIDADALRKPIYAEEDNITGSGMTYAEMDGYNDGIDAAWRRIDNAPTIDAEPVRHGRWEEIQLCRIYNEDIVYSIGYKCNQCGRVESKKEPYCHCGAKMDEVSE